MMRVMNRLLVVLTLSGSAGCGPSPVEDVTGWVAGTHYEVLPSPGPRRADGKIEVVEYFSYGCSHCYTLDPQLVLWLRKQPTVEFRQVPLAAGEISTVYARLFYTLELLGRADLHMQVFEALHRRRERLAVNGDERETVVLQRDFASRYGVATDEFMQAYESPAVAESVRHAAALAKANRIAAVPMVIVGGRYLTSPAMTGGHEELISVLNELVKDK